MDIHNLGYITRTFPPGHGSTSTHPLEANALGHRCVRNVDPTCHGGDASTEPYIVAYRLKLPDYCRIHPVFHVSVLRPYSGSSEKVGVAELPTEFIDGSPVAFPVCIHGRRTCLVQGRSTDQLLVEWSDAGKEEATWESVEYMTKYFPDFHLGDKVNFDGVENVIPQNTTGLRPIDEEQSAQEEEHSMPRRAQREKRRPAWQSDYYVT
ncbi:hypothetical protein CASFOL_031550 [Castilleja foliolosa]|uniref:Tf2-1-like SH3-like domain-containing protein n=1 Tax=Castilleja foliolosa TaxID=1961234 RepID=A0ABD3C5P6_9LAMI